MKNASKVASLLVPAALAAMMMGTGSANAAAAAAASEPAIVKAVPPTYPRSAQRREIEGDVTVAIDVDDSGTVTNVIVTKADPAGIFDTAAINAVKRWKFESGKPAQGLVKVIKFKVEG